MANDAALVLVDALLSLDVLLLLVDEGVTFGLRVFSHASLHADLMVFTIEELYVINVVGTEGTPGSVLVLGVLGFLGPGEGSNFSFVLVTLS